jgi:hypothetical protein
VAHVKPDKDGAGMVLTIKDIAGGVDCIIDEYEDGNWVGYSNAAVAFIKVPAIHIDKLNK